MTQTTLSSLYEGTTLAEKLKNYRMNGVKRLFKEFQAAVVGEKLEPLLNFQEDDDETTLSLKKLYLKHWSDPTELTFVDVELGGRWDLWHKICDAKDFKRYLQPIKEEARARYLSNNIRAIGKLAEEADTKTRMAALKFLTQTILNDSDTPRGRPSKKEIQQRTNELLQDDRDIQEAFARVVPIEAVRAAKEA